MLLLSRFCLDKNTHKHLLYRDRRRNQLRLTKALNDKWRTKERKFESRGPQCSGMANEDDDKHYY